MNWYRRPYIRVYLGIIYCVCISPTNIRAITSSCINSASPLLQTRSLSFYLSREMVGLLSDQHLYQYNTDTLYYTIALAGEYAHSFNTQALIPCLFGDGTSYNNETPQLSFSGSLAPAKSPRNWLADYFYTPPDLQSSVTFDPHVESYIANATFFMGLDRILRGLYLWAHAPLVHTRWALNPREIPTMPEQDAWAGYYAPVAIEVANLRPGVLPALTGSNPPTLENIAAVPLKYSQWYCGTQSRIGVADVRVAVGWNMLQDENYHFGLSARVAAPTGTQPEGIYFFEPIIGNGHHWELGAGLSAHAILWRSADFSEYCGLHLESAFMHLFPTKQYRNFDLCNAPNSRYALAIALAKPVEDSLGSAPEPDDEPEPANRQFRNIIQYVANLTHAPVDVSIAIQADVCLLLNYTCACWSFDIGYELWATSCERIQFDPQCQSMLARGPLWALKGDAQLFGYDRTVDPITAVALNVSENQATIFAGTNRPCSEPANPATLQSNSGVDSPEFAFSGNTILGTQPDIVSPDIQQSTPAQLLTAQDIDIFSARTQGRSHSFIINAAYTFNCACYAPFISIGARAEWGTHRDNARCPIADECLLTNRNCASFDCPSVFSQCQSCSRCTLSQAFFTIKGGASF